MAISIYRLRTNSGLVTGLSTDTKPNCRDGTLFIEEDTARIFRREAGAWVEKMNTRYTRA